jgi:hypothetical protein
MLKMNSYIKTESQNFMANFLVFNLLWIFKVVKKMSSDS